jgi:hypothetical protein
MVAEQLSSLVIRASNQPEKIQKNKHEETGRKTKRRIYLWI